MRFTPGRILYAIYLGAVSLEEFHLRNCHVRDDTLPARCFRFRQLLHLGRHVSGTLLRHLPSSLLPPMADPVACLQDYCRLLAACLRRGNSHSHIHQTSVHLEWSDTFLQRDMAD
ncbi:Hypothetical predicted protein [Octopus vulgaris]|uniref:Uncharacterized protein n=1 Tax=Octopus vulgaris TaxID=6645 RepID=A0AA36BX55_OCTVU|nr:Hypothetical predicted protein [Octopus vulgaris]